MKEKIFFLFIFISLTCQAQIYQYIGVENGLSNRRVYSIQKDKKGYMWFLTHDGIDRYDGKIFKHYKLNAGGTNINSFVNLNKLYTDTCGCIWEIGKNGQIFKYNTFFDKYQLISEFSEEGKESGTCLNFAHIDRNNNIWLCTKDKQYIYNISTRQYFQLNNPVKENINCIEQTGNNTYFIGTFKGLYYAKLTGKNIQRLPQKVLDSLSIPISTLYYHKANRKLFIGSFLKGIFIYDKNKGKITHLKTGLEDVNINCIRPLNSNEILVATDGAGIYKINTETDTCEPYIIAEYNETNGMNGNNINDIYIDEEKRIWMANYPMGITIRNNRYPSYKWIKHSIGNVNTLINDQVNAIIEDSDGDLWFATNNGVSVYNTHTDQWTNLLSSFQKDTPNKNHIFTTLCEVTPGEIWIGGYISGMYRVYKRDFKPHYFTPASFNRNILLLPDKYIRSIIKSSDGTIWSGGYYNLKSFNLSNKTIELYPGLNGINDIEEKDSLHIWLGTTNGLFLLNKKTKKFNQLKLPIESDYINAIYQDNHDSLLYIGTSGSGLVVYNLHTAKSTVYTGENSSLISNSIYSILPDHKGSLILSTENSLSRFNIKNRIFSNWTKEQGLLSCHFNATSGTCTSWNTFILGSGNGAIEFQTDVHVPRNYQTKLIFSDFRLFYQQVHSGEKDSPLKKDIDDTDTLELKYNQNIFSLKLSSINYDYPSNILYSWKLDGFFNEWSKPSEENLVRYTNLNSGTYKLRVRSISKEDHHIIEEKSIVIIIHPPLWATVWAFLFYTLILGFITWAIIRYNGMKKDRMTSEDKVQFFINTAHDIRTPLTLIKAPLDEIQENENLSFTGQQHLQMAIRNTDNLFKLISNLINFEKIDVYSSKLNISEYELRTFIEEILKQFESYASGKQIKLTFDCNFTYLNVWFDRSKMESILKNLLSNAIKYTPEKGEITVIATNSLENWSIEVKDTGIGIPSNEQKKLFKVYFRGSNAVNSKITGSGIGLLLVQRLVSKHKGNISVKSTENKGSSFKVTFSHGNKQYRKEKVGKPDNLPETGELLPNPSFVLQTSPQNDLPVNLAAQRLLIVEDNDELREYLKQTLSPTYTVYTASDGKAGLDMVKIAHPDLIISDIMMPQMRGDELCRRLKNDIESSHIPIILLTALGDKQNIMEGLATKADRYITKPFDIAILRATIANLLANRALLKKRFAHLEIQESESDNYTSTLDLEFMQKVKETIEMNLDNTQFNVDILCGTLNMSRTSFYNKIKALTDQTPSDFIRSNRMNKAAELLKNKQYSISEVADMTGFSDVKYFREVFKKTYGVSPSKYMEKYNI